MLKTAIECVQVRPVVFDPTRALPSGALPVKLRNGKECMLTHDGVVAGVTEEEFMAQYV